ncbi:MAG: VOC family protein [Bacteroidota bacterium]|nr:VOC family protein [Bacteroidota bacterium]MDP4234743.1 VOC family protein [Bacteroidota bacterium]MDP4242635.1 VOC family protein [Bacteroidota bacterium]MDP4286803.1 VOC family protein [Bacteroidota bacterium]
MIKDILGVTIYVDDFERVRDFYAHTLGLEQSSDAGLAEDGVSPNACFFRIADNSQAVYLEGGHTRRDANPDENGLSFMFVVDSAHATHARLTEAGVRFIHDAPQDLGQGNYWFRFYDPAGNIVEIVSTSEE